LKFEAEGRKFAKMLRSLEQFIQTEFLVTECFFNLFQEFSHIRTITIQIGKKNIGIEKHTGNVRKLSKLDSCKSPKGMRSCILRKVKA
jgi:hypothetical protein